MQTSAGRGADARATIANMRKLLLPASTDPRIDLAAAIPAEGTLLLAETILDDSPAPHLGKLIDIEMIAFVGGKERTAGEFRELLAPAGFALQRIVPTRSPFFLVEAVPC